MAGGPPHYGCSPRTGRPCSCGAAPMLTYDFPFSAARGQVELVAKTPDRAALSRGP